MATTPLKYLNQYFTTILNVGGGLDNSQTTGIVIQSVSGLDITKPGVACLTYSSPINTSTAEWITYTSINGSNELQGVVRGAEGFSAKTHLNGAVVAFPLSESHINDINAMFDSTGLDIKQIATPANPDSGRNKLYFKSDGKVYTLNSSGTERGVGGGDQTEVFIIPGTLPSSATTNISKTWFAPAALTISTISLYVTTAGASTGTTYIDVNKNGTTVFTTQGNRPALTTTDTSSTGKVPDVTAVAAGDAITIDVDSTTATAPVDAYVLIHYTRD